MPIFVSRFSPGRVAGANLQGVRTRQDGAEGRVGAARTERRTERSREQEGRQGPIARAREELLVSNQRGALLSERLQERRGSRAGRTGLAAPESGGETGAGRRVLPGVRALRSRADREVDRPGRLEREPSPVLQQTLDRLAGLRSAARQTRAQARDGQGGGEGVSARVETPAADRGVDAQVRLLAPGTRTGSVGRVEGRLRTAAAEMSTAEEIGRANTTPEIRRNLQEDTREVRQGLLRDAGRQEQANTRRFVQNSARAAENRREREVRSNTAQVRNLRTEERSLERELVETQREIRNRQNETRRLQGPASRSTTATAAGLGSRVNILAS